LWVWEDAGRVVHLTGVNPPSAGVARIGPVYTPAEFRGHGYAGATVAAISGRLLAQGARVCLFTDQANPVSNGLYQRIGFRPVVDMANFVIDR
jgi:predicted GNAT family acetyltransferase